MEKVAVISQNLFAEGVAQRLKEHPFGGEIVYLTLEEDLLARLTALQPAVILLDVVATGEHADCILCKLLTHFPEVTIIRLMTHAKNVQVISGSLYFVPSVKALIKLLERQQTSSIRR